MQACRDFVRGCDICSLTPSCKAARDGFAIGHAAARLHLAAHLLIAMIEDGDQRRRAILLARHHHRFESGRFAERAQKAAIALPGGSERRQFGENDCPGEEGSKRRMPSTAYVSAVPWLTRSQISVCCKKRAVSGPATFLLYPNLSRGSRKTFDFRQLIDAARGEKVSTSRATSPRWAHSILL